MLDPWLDENTWMRGSNASNSSLPGNDGDVYIMAAISVLLGIMILITIIGKSVASAVVVTGAQRRG